MTGRGPTPSASPSAGTDRASLMKEHRTATVRRDAATLDSAEFRAAAKEVARIEVAIARLEEPGAKSL